MRHYQVQQRFGECLYKFLMVYVRFMKMERVVAICRLTLVVVPKYQAN